MPLPTRLPLGCTRDWGRAVLETVGRIRRSWLGLLGAVGLVTVTGVIAPAVAAPATNVIVLPGATSAEGIAVGRGSTFYAGDLFGGDIFRGDLQRGTVELFIDTPPGQMSVGLKVDDASGLLFVAGGFSGQGFVYDALTGASVATYQFGAPGQSIINDVVVTQAGAWFTDSANASLYFVPIGPGGTLGAFSVLTVTGPAADTSGEFNLNGIAATPDGRTLIVAHSTTEELYTVDPVTGESTILAPIPGPDGILYEAGRLWVAQPFLNQVSRLRLSPDLTSGVVEETITSPLFQTPTTVAIHGNRLAAANAKFDTGLPPTADEYEIVIVDR
jgi:sugar lactone lactonase YvrE